MTLSVRETAVDPSNAKGALGGDRTLARDIDVRALSVYAPSLSDMASLSKPVDIHDGVVGMPAS